MHQQAIDFMLEQIPFQPFRLFLADGGHCDVVDPSLCTRTHSALSVRLPDGRFVMVDPQHVTRIEQTLIPNPTVTPVEEIATTAEPVITESAPLTEEPAPTKRRRKVADK